MKTVLKLAMIAVFSIAITNCAKETSKALDLTISNIEGVWKATGNSLNNFISFTFTTMETYTIVRSTGETISGAFYIDDDDYIELDGFGYISETDLEEDAFDFQLHEYASETSSGSDYDITTEKYDNSSNNNTSTTSSLLTSSKWYVYENYDYEYGEKTSNDILSECSNARQVWMWYKADGTFWVDNSACGGPSGAQQLSTWEFINNNTEIYLHDSENLEGGTFQIISLTSSTLELFSGDPDETYPNAQGLLSEYRK
jgi:hypothetical protein